MEAKISKGPMASLMTWLGAEGIEYEIHEHTRSFTAAATARAEGVDPRTFEKVIWVRSTEGGDALMVVDSEDHLDLKKAREVLKSGRVTLVPEDEIEELAPDCDSGRDAGSREPLRSPHVRRLRGPRRPRGQFQCRKPHVRGPCRPSGVGEGPGSRLCGLEGQHVARTPLVPFLTSAAEPSELARARR